MEGMLLVGKKSLIYDVEYVDNVSFIGDWKIIFLTIKKVFIREGINSETAATMEPFKGNGKGSIRL